jgi:hypothetical protein
MDCSVLQGRVSPYTLQTLLEATAALTHTYCGVLSTSSLGRGLAPPLQSVSHRRIGRPAPPSTVAVSCAPLNAIYF